MIGALTIQPGWPEQLKFAPPLSDLHERISIAYNRGWINGVMDAGMKVVDIGRSKNYRGQPVSKWYQEEVKEVGRRSYSNYERRIVFDTASFLSYGR